MPIRMPPTGRMKKPTPKVAVVSNSEAYWVSAGKNSREMTTVRNPKTMKSYHSSALPITAAAICRALGVERRTGIGASLFTASQANRVTLGTLENGTCQKLNGEARNRLFEAVRRL
jgi:2-methylaconitate cis-trans-isomerase PrpF